jgi:hypothetical protein
MASASFLPFSPHPALLQGEGNKKVSWWKPTLKHQSADPLILLKHYTKASKELGLGR